MSLNEKELSGLWNEIRLGNQQAFSVIYKKLYPKLYASLKRFVKDDVQIDDILQDTFLKIWLKRESIGEIDSVAGYFFTVTRSVGITNIRNLKMQELSKERIESGNLQDGNIKPVEDTITQYETNLGQKRMIEAALKKLPARQREIIRLRFYESLDCKEIGEVTGIQYQSVVNHMYRAVRTLRKLYSSEAELRVA